ncbi:MAG: hypothetical protein WKF57_10970 [Nakamurella sp.]
MRRRRRRTVLLTVGCVLALTSCTTAGTAAPGTAGTPTTPRTSAPPAPGATGTTAPDVVATYGYAPDPQRGGYRPDVVLIGGGPAAIRSAGDDGLSFTLDHSAAGVDDLREGSIMFAASEAVGRVVHITPAGADRIVTIAPVLPSELVDQLEFAQTGPLDLDTATAVLRPGMSGAVVQQSTGPSTPGLRGGPRFLAPSGPSTPKDPQPGPVAGEQSIGGWQVKLLRAPGTLGVNVIRTQDDLIGDVSVSVLTNHPRVQFSGNPGTKAFTAKISGITGVALDAKAGFGPGDPSRASAKVGGELEHAFTFPIPPSPATGGLPMVLTVTFAFSISLGFGAKNSTLSASAEYGLDGDLGIDGTTSVVPTLTVKRSLMDSIDGISLAPSAMVAAVKVKFMLGVGVPFGNAGPYVSMSFASGVAKGSPLAINPGCHYGSLDITGKAGLGFDIDSGLAALILGKLGTALKFPDSIETKLAVVHREQTLPDVAACKIA